MSSVPIQKGLRHEVLIIISEEVSDVPVPVVVPLDLLIQSVIFFEDERLCAQLVLGLLLLLLLLLVSDG